MRDIPGLSTQLEPYKAPDGKLSTREPQNIFLPYDVGTIQPEYEKQLKELQGIKREVEPFKKAEREIKAEKDKRESVEELYTKLKNLPKEEANRQARELKKVDPNRYSQLKQMVKDKKAGVSLSDEVVRNMELAPRTNYLIQELNKISSKEEKNIKVREWRSKGIVTDGIMKKFKEAKKAGTLKAPGTVAGIRGAMPISPPSNFKATATEIRPPNLDLTPGSLPQTPLGIITGGKGTFSQGFGARPRVYNRYGLAGHEGYDYVMPSGSPIRNPFKTAVVEKVGNDPSGYGNYVGLKDQATGKYILLGHLSKVGVREGQTVNIGQAVGLSGNTGHSEAPHVHISYTPNYQTRLARSGGYGGFSNPSQFLGRKIN